VTAALELYSRILDEVERRDYDVFTARASVPG
jgi:phytoene/squalene synthetase